MTKPTSTTFRPFYAQTSSALAHWQPLLNQWIENIKRYCERIEDVPYWHSEQANVFLLAASALQVTGWTALVEFPNRKDNTIASFGRVDAWIKPDKGEDYIEAKHCWLDLHSPQSLPIIHNSLEKAIVEAKRIPYDENRIGVVFICPRHTKQQADQSVTLLEKLQSDLLMESFDATAWAFPTLSHEPWSPRTNKIYPGVILLARLV